MWLALPGLMGHPPLTDAPQVPAGRRVNQAPGRILGGRGCSARPADQDRGKARLQTHLQLSAVLKTQEGQEWGSV